MFEYSPQDIVPSWGSLILDDFQDGTFIVGTRAEDGVTSHVGSTGAVTATLNANRMGNITATIVQQSTINTALYKSVEKQERTRKLDKRPFQITDLTGFVLVSAPNAWIRKMADPEFAKESGPRVWIWDCDILIVSQGVKLR